MSVAKVSCDLCDWWVAEILTDASARLRRHKAAEHNPLAALPPASRLEVEVELMAEGILPLPTRRPEARITYSFTGTPTAFRAWCRAYADGSGK